MHFKLLSTIIAASVGTAAVAAPAVHPILVSKTDAAGRIFTGPNAHRIKQNGHTSIDNVVMKSSDGKMEAGMYKSGPAHFQIKDRTYGVDEFMLFTSGSVTLTSIDGAVTRLKAGDAVIVPQEWKGRWDSPGYTKYYVIYSRTGKGM